ncbi:MAG: glycosyltransferase, partial [Holophaga sp.]
MSEDLFDFLPSALKIALPAEASDQQQSTTFHRREIFSYQPERDFCFLQKTLGHSDRTNIGVRMEVAGVELKRDACGSKGFIELLDFEHSKAVNGPEFGELGLLAGRPSACCVCVIGTVQDLSSLEQLALMEQALDQKQLGSRLVGGDEERGLTSLFCRFKSTQFEQFTCVFSPSVSVFGLHVKKDPISLRCLRGVPNCTKCLGFFPQLSMAEFHPQPPPFVTCGVIEQKTWEEKYSSVVYGTNEGWCPIGNHKSTKHGCWLSLYAGLPSCPKVAPSTERLEPMKLLVVIPTWNRADCLDKAIQAISEARSQAQNCTVELFISDNCSSDHTPEVTSKWLRQAPWIHLKRWDTHTSHWGEILERALLHS